MSNDPLRDIAKLRRDMPRNQIVMRVCDELERLIVDRFSFKTEYEAPAPDSIASASLVTTRVPFDKRAYMRDYMRKRRAEQKDG